MRRMLRRHADVRHPCRRLECFYRRRFCRLSSSVQPPSTIALPGKSHPQPVRLPPAPGKHRGLRWLEAGLSRTLVDGRKGTPKLHSGLHGLDLRDWLLVDDDPEAGSSSYEYQMNIKREALSNPKRRSEVLAASDLTTYGAQKEVLRMVQAHLSARYPHRFRDILSTNISSEVLGTEAVAGEGIATRIAFTSSSA